MTPKILSAMAAAATFAFLSLGAVATAQAAPQVTVVVHAGAQAHGQPVYLPVHQPSYRPGYRPGHIWVEGHWQRRGPRSVWQPGHWERSRPAYRPHHGAVHYPKGHHGKRQAPRWDRDGDGVPNRHDRRPNNPNRY